MKKEKKISLSTTGTTVFGVVPNPCMLSPSPSLPYAHFPGPPTRSRLEEQLMGVFQSHDQGSQSADELPTEPREGPSGMAHRTSTFLRLTGSLSNVLGTSQRRCSTSVSLSPSPPFAISTGVCSQLSLPLSLHPLS